MQTLQEQIRNCVRIHSKLNTAIYRMNPEQVLAYYRKLIWKNQGMHKMSKVEMKDLNELKSWLLSSSLREHVSVL